MSVLLFADSWIVIVAKDAGEPVQTRDPSQRSIVTTVREQMNYQWLQPVHRIDQPVSGAVVLARDKSTFARVQQALARGEMRRAYLAVLDTAPEPAEGVLRDRLVVPGKRTGRDERTRVAPPGQPGVDAELSYKTLGRTDHHTIVLVELVTGRHHQIRGQFSHRGWHVVGDARYGARRPMKDRSIALHAWYLSFPHPMTGDTLVCTADLPDTPLWRGVSQALSALPGEGVSQER